MQPSNKKKEELDYFLYKKFKNSQKKKVLFILKSIGYNIKPATKSDKKYIILIKAYQMHFRQKNVSGKIDRDTYIILLSQKNVICFITKTCKRNFGHCLVVQKD